MRNTLLLCLVFGLTNAIVEYTNSALYDIYDFYKTDEVHLTKCDFGCLIFAATQGESFVQYPDNLDPYAMNLIITDNDNENNTYSIAELSTNRDEKNRKLPLTITGNKNISVVNMNDPAETFFSTVLLYVVEKTKAEEFNYEVYDIYYTNKKKFTPSADIITFMGGWMHRIHADASTQPNSVTARLTGFDNAQDNNKDGCPYAFTTVDGPSFPGFTINSNPQMISFVIAKRNPIQFSVDLQYSSLPEIGTNGFINTPGWNGCTKPNNGGIQVFRTQYDLPEDTYIFMDTEEFNVTIDVVPNFDAKHKVVVQDRNDPIPVVFTGTQEQQHDFSYATNVAVMFQNMRGDQVFLLRYSSAFITKATTMTPTTESSTAPSSTSTTPSVTSPTTSSGFRTAGWMISALVLLLSL